MGEEAYKGEEEYPELSRDESGETVKEKSEVEENKKNLNENYGDEAEAAENYDQAEEEELTHLNGKKNEENGEGMEHLNYQGDLRHEEEIKEEDYDSQNQVSVYSFSLLFLSYCSSFISAPGFSASL